MLSETALLPGEAIRMIQSIVAKRFRIPIEAMRWPSRARKYARPRQLAMSLAVEFTKKSHGTVARHFERDRATVTYAVAIVELRAAKSRFARLDLAELRERVRELPMLEPISDRLAVGQRTLNPPTEVRILVGDPAARPNAI